MVTISWKNDSERHSLASYGIKTVARGQKSPDEYLDMDWGDLFVKASVLIIGLNVASSMLSKGRVTLHNIPEGHEMVFGFDSKEVAEESSRMLRKKFNVKPKVELIDYTDEGDLVWGVFVPEEKSQEISSYMESIVSKYSHLIGTAMGKVSTND